MADIDCATIVRYSADLRLMPSASLRQEALTHIDGCDDCRTYQSQMAATRHLLRRHGSRAELTADESSTGTDGLGTPSGGRVDYTRLREALLARAQLLDPVNAEDLTQRTLEEGLLLQKQDSRPRDVHDLTAILHELVGAQERFDDDTVPESAITAGQHAAEESLDGLDGDADGPRLLYPDLYPAAGEPDGWVDSPRRWTTGTTLVPGLEEIEETDEVYRLVDGALDELPDSLGDLLSLVDLQGQSIDDAADLLSLERNSAVDALGRARNHVRGRLDDYLR